MPTCAAVWWSRAQSAAGGFDLRKYTAPYGKTGPIATSFARAGPWAKPSVPPTPGRPAARPTAADALTSAAVRIKSRRVISRSSFIVLFDYLLKISRHPLHSLVHHRVGQAVVVPRLLEPQFVSGAIEHVHLLRLIHRSLHVLRRSVAIQLRLHHQHRPRRNHAQQVLIVVRNLRLMSDKESQLRNQVALRGIPGHAAIADVRCVRTHRREARDRDDALDARIQRCLVHRYVAAQRVAKQVDPVWIDQFIRLERGHGRVGILYQASHVRPLREALVERPSLRQPAAESALVIDRKST